jgi:HSP20 family protein
MKEEVPTMVESPEVFKLLPEDRFFKRMADLYQIIARRAYELFCAGGFKHGYDRENWFQAESEIITPLPLEMSETEDAITVKSVLPGYTAKDVEIHVEPKRLFITGQQQQKSKGKKREAVRSAERVQRIFQSIELTAQVDPEKVSATLSNGELQIELAKGKTGNKVAAARAAA